MKNSSLSQDDLAFFISLYRCQSLSVCAQKLGLSISGASRTLSHLREVFGNTLFQRNRDGLIPTAEARELYPKIVKLLHDYDELFHPLVFDPKTAKRRIRVLCADFGATFILGRVIPRILEKAPLLDFEIQPIENDLVGKLKSGDAEFGIFPTENDVPALFSCVIYESRYRYVVRKGHPLEAIYATQGYLTPEDLHAYGFVSGAVPPGAGVDLSYLGDTSRINQSGVAKISTPYITSMPILISGTDLVGALPENLIWQSQRQTLPIVPLCPVFGETVHRPHLIWHERDDDDPLMQWIRALFVHTFKQQA